MQDQLAGGGGTEGVYGSLTYQSVRRLAAVLLYLAPAWAYAVFADFGAGLGR